MTDYAPDLAFQQGALTYLLTFFRVQACFMSLPALSERSLPVRVRVALAMAVSPLLAEFSTLVAMPADLVGLGLLAGAEVITGLVLGGIVRLAALAMDIAASTISATASLSQLMGVGNDYATHPIGSLLHIAGVALLMALGFPILACDMLRESLVLRPLGQWLQIDALLPSVIGIASRGFVLAMLMAAPFTLGGFLFQLLTGMISKAMPSLPVVFIGAPAAILMALIGLAILSPSVLSLWADAVLAQLGVALE